MAAITRLGTHRLIEANQKAAEMPRKPEQERILSCLAHADALLGAEIERASVLRELKSGLLDDLLTGRVRVTPLLEDGGP